ncbi:MAG: P-type conjugative transfer ATPase TrbB [Fusobacteriaceae bacterium]|jgi:type IV secretion system protein VirB11|nr:P-type conjugative transfer ATPase TrbB [Fusobacteriaceae bacterium]
MNNENNNTKEILEYTFGKDVMKFLNDDDIIEIMLNDDQHLWTDSLTKGMIDTGIIINSDVAKNAIYLIASSIYHEINEINPCIDAELPISGERFHGDIPPIVINPTFSIRKKAVLIFSLDDYVEKNIMTENHKNVICEAVKNHKNILVVGGTGSGKTTLCNAIIQEIAKFNERIIIIEDTRELQYSGDNKIYYRTSETKKIRDLIFNSMRMRPDRIFVGELRDGAALELLKAWNSGHPGGICTIHANSVSGGLRKLEQYIMEVSANSQSEVIADVVNVVVYIEKHKLGREVKEIVEVIGYDNRNYIYKKVE